MRFYLEANLLLFALCLCVVVTSAADNENTDTDTVNYYELLGVPTDCTLRQLKKAYRQAALAHHPDKFSSAEDKKREERIFVKIVKAYETLADEATRQAYDDFIAKGGKDFDTAGDRDYQNAYERWKRHEEAERRSLILGGAGTLLCLVATGYLAYKEANRRKERKRRQREAVVGSVQSLSEQEQRELQDKKRQEQLRRDAKRRGKSEAEKRKLESEQQEVVKVQYTEARSTAQDEQQRFKSRPVKSGSWSVDETSALARALAKFPGGTSRRWERVMEYVNNSCHSKDGEAVRSEKDCTKMARLVNAGIVRKEDIATEPRIPASDYSGGSRTEAGETTATATTTTTTAAGETQPTDSKVSDWTPEQQRNLELALKRYPPESKLPANGVNPYATTERWRLIAAAVPGKTKKQCIERFKEIRVRVLQRRG